MKKLIIFCFIIIFQIIVKIQCRYVPVERSHHTATLVEKKIFFLGGHFKNGNLNDFFFLDLSKSIDTEKPMPLIDLSVKALTLPPHYAASASLYGEDSIFLFGGYVSGSFNDPSLIGFSFNSTQLKWNPVTVSQGDIPTRETTMKAVTDNGNKIYIFSGGDFNSTNYEFSTKMNIFNTINNSWTISESGLPGRDGYTATFLSDVNDIIYIGGNSQAVLGDLTNLNVYNTQSNSWRKVTTKNPPESRYGHSAVLTNDGRIVIFGGSQINNLKYPPVNNQYVVLDTKTFEWYLGTGDVSTSAPYMHHTATLYNDYMFIAFGVLNSGQLSNNILIYKIGDYANFTLQNTNFNSGNINEFILGAIIGGTLSGILSITIFGYIGFVTIKRYKETSRISKFEHALNT